MTAPAADGADVSPQPDAADGRSRSICPYLLSADGTWRGVTAQRSHRCGALDPPALIAATKQRRLCLGPAHARCPTFIAAAEAVESLAPARPASRFPVPRTTPVVLERGRPTLSPAILTRQRGLAQGALLGLMAIAVLAILVARVGSPGGDPAAPAGGPGASLQPSPSPSPSPTPRPSPSPEPSPSPSPSLSPSSSPSPSTRPSPTPRRFYVVQAGDNLSAIAVRFGTTVAVLVRLNDISDPSLIHVGQKLVLP